MLDTMIIGQEYEFIDETARLKYRGEHSQNRDTADKIGNAGKFKLISGKNDGVMYAADGKEVVSVYVIEINGERFSKEVNLICRDEMKYFQEAIPSEVREESEFMAIPLSRMVQLFKHYHPTASDSKITVAGMRRCWQNHKKVIADAKQRKADLESEIKNLEILL
ncbi:hypothetical protein phiAS5_ORF0073 [Aeromonas phage phiAS5]|uniref:Uncharacterized protein n=1 Tax=Aeromonas phage phiAS5 TaxID=879630 RepID=E1A2H0_9CAUD|nr:hypothetical protein phiAS5_ORF0073 [Aeromonas phage phiAS5]ADM79916.1 hypothetical protein phiAS5_ORF0073 [Aeromonas phage phiAS5]BES53313.1 hypothetical protein [Aeromonas phage phiWae14]